jgi:catechol 2,3-dioxygenase-like lactoylglutathione lyase family enzyme
MTLTAATIDHVNLVIPADGIPDLVEFYADRLGFEVENRDLYERGEKGFVSVRLTPTSIIHVQPRDDFEPPTEGNYDHVAVAVEEDAEAVRESLADAGIEVEREIDALGAVGTTPSLYVRDPFGYLVEISTAG